MVFLPILAPLAPFRGEGPGVRGFDERDRNPKFYSYPAPSSPALLPRKAGGEGSQRGSCAAVARACCTDFSSNNQPPGTAATCSLYFQDDHRQVVLSLGESSELGHRRLNPVDDCCRRIPLISSSSKRETMVACWSSLSVIGGVTEENTDGGARRFTSKAIAVWGGEERLHRWRHRPPATG